MSEKLCLRWSEFKENLNSTFGRLRNDKEFTDVTLVCEDGQEIKAHKVILTASSIFFEKILLNRKHPHPLIYLKGFQSKHFASILDFVYFGEARVYQEDFDSFLALAEEIQLKGLAGQISRGFIKEEEEKTQDLFEKSSEQTSTDLMEEPIHQSGNLLKNPKNNQQQDLKHKEDAEMMVIPNEIRTDLKTLDEKVKLMMEKGKSRIPHGMSANGTPINEISRICKVCGKEGRSNVIKHHIQMKHLEVSIPCDFCDKTFSARANLNDHKNKFHR